MPPTRSTSSARRCRVTGSPASRADRLGRRAHRRSVDRADGPARLRPLRRPGWRLGLGGDHPIGGLDPDALRRHPRHAGHGQPDPRSRANRRPQEQRALGGHEVLSRLGFRATPKQQSTRPQTAGLRPDRFAGGPGGLDPREVLGLDRLRRPSREHLEPRRAAGQRDAVLGDRLGDVVGPAVLGELRPAWHRASR